MVNSISHSGHLLFSQQPIRKLVSLQANCNTVVNNRATSWQNQQSGMCAQWRLRSAWASAQSDQSLRCPHELIYPLSAQRRLWSDWADAQADLSLHWAHMPFCWFCLCNAFECRTCLAWHIIDAQLSIRSSVRLINIYPGIPWHLSSLLTNCKRRGVLLRLKLCSSMERIFMTALALTFVLAGATPPSKELFMPLILKKLRKLFYSFYEAFTQSFVKIVMMSKSCGNTDITQVPIPPAFAKLLHAAFTPTCVKAV